MKTKTHKNTYFALRSFLSYLAQYKFRVFIVFTMFIISNLLLAVVPIFVGRLVGTLATNPSNTHHAYMYVWILIACSTGHDLLWRICELLYKRYLNSVSFEYETVVFEQTMQRPYPYFVDKFTGKLASYTNLLGKELREFMEHLFWEYAGHIVSLISVAIILTAINWQTGLVFVAGLVLLFIVGSLTMKNSTKHEKIWADIGSTKNGKIFDAIANFVNVKSFQKESKEINTIEQEQSRTIGAANRSFGWNIVFWGSMSVVVRNMIWPVSIALNVYLYLHGVISLADLTTFLTAVVLFTTYIWNIIWSVSQFSLQMARSEEAHTYLFGHVNIITNPIMPKPKVRQVSFDDSITFGHIGFAYPDKPDTDVLKNINLTIKKGEKIGIVGKSGSGKTTFTKLLLDYYPLGTGTILVDGQHVTNRELSSLVSYVPQDTTLFHRTIAENIAYASAEDSTHEDIVQAAKLAHADEFVKKIDQAYEALVGERGVKLSSGQRQRIAIARAFLNNKPLLVLDEATSALDTESEMLVQKALENLWHDKTVIAIAHRLSTLRNMDRILVIDNGMIAEQGSHDELLKQKGKYAKLWAHQSDGFLED